MPGVKLASFPSPANTARGVDRAAVRAAARAGRKAASLPSWEGWDRLGEPPAISRLLVVRRTRATRSVAGEFAAQLRLAYPAHPDDAMAALTGRTVRWPGPALIWAEVGASRARLLPGR